MQSRHYGIQPDNTTYRGPQMSPERHHYDTEPVQMQDYHPPSLQPGVRSPPRRPVAPYERRPDAAPAQTAYYGGSQQSPTRYRESTTTPNQDAYGRAAVGAGMAGMAAGIADARPRQSGYEDFRDDQGPFSDRMASPPPQDCGARSQYAQQPTGGMYQSAPRTHRPEEGLRPHAAAPAPMGGDYYDAGMPRGRSPYQGDGYDEIDPRAIEDDGDDGVEYRRQRQSRFGRSAAAGAGVGGAAVGVFGARDASGNYDPIPGGQSGARGGAEKSEWLRKQSGGSKRLKWIVGTIIVLLILGGVAGAVAGVLLSRDESGSGGSSDSAPDLDQIDGLLDIDSPQVQKVMGNKNLHRVFPGMDYSPLKTQYPDCIHDPPDQNNVTLDVAVLSQLTPAIRLYGTDCNQTEMVLEAIQRLDMADDVHVWLGVYLDGNQTTNDRQISQMWDVIDNYDVSHFAGVIVGNEVLYSKYITLAELGDIVSSFRTNLTNKGIHIPVSTADLGDAWTTGLAQDSDIVMANVHPFFAGVTPDKAPGWTWTFWQGKDEPLAVHDGSDFPPTIIAETGWPSEGGNSDGSGEKPPSPTVGSVASIDNLNTFMDGWVCEALANATTYFWFEAFDEPWKVRFDDPEVGNFWEPHWGLLDVNRNLKDGVVIPECGGQTVDKPYPQWQARR